MKRQFAVWGVIFAVLAGGCATPGETVGRPALSPEQLAVLVEGGQTAVTNYLAAVVSTPTPAQQLGLDALNVLVQLVLVELREAGAYAEARALEGQLEPDPPLEPL